MTNPDGLPIWYELITPDPDAAQAFYGAVMGWTAERQGGGMGDYRVLSAGETGVGGIMVQPDAMPGGPKWLPYFGVADVDGMTDMVRHLGGEVQLEPTDIPGVGRFSFVTDPQGAAFYLMRGDSDEDSRSFAPTVEGHCSWNELVTSDQDAALDFYGKLFGWTKAGAMPMPGDMGDYTFYQRDDAVLGAMMNSPDETTRPYWNFAFRVGDIDTAHAAVETGGGTVRHGPVEIPGGDWLIQADDGQGAKVMFTGSREG